MHQYHDLYHTLELPLLANVFKNFWHISLNYYKSDPSDYYTVSGLSFDDCFEMTTIEFKPLCDHKQFLFIENSIRGGVSIINHRRSTANNEFVSDTTQMILPHSFGLTICTAMKWDSPSNSPDDPTSFIRANKEIKKNYVKNSSYRWQWRWIHSRSWQ